MALLVRLAGLSFIGPAALRTGAVASRSVSPNRFTSRMTWHGALILFPPQAGTFNRDVKSDSHRDSHG
jgi:hypothetical protein